MTLFSGHELATAVATTAALLSVLLGGQMHPFAWAAVALVPLGGYLRFRGRGLSTSLGGALAVLAVLFGGLFVAREGLGSILLGAGYALCLLVSVRLLNRETPAHDLQLYALSLLLVLDAAALNITWLYAPCFLGYTVAIVWALTTRELKRAAQSDHDDRHGVGEAPLWRERGVLRGRFFAVTALIALVVLGATLSLFVLFPRVGLGMLRLANGRTSGFATSVTLGGGGGISQDPTVVMRVDVTDEGDPLPMNLYYRGAAFDRYDGRTWERSTDLSDKAPTAAARMPKAGSGTRRYRVSLQPLGVPYVFAAGRVAKVRVQPGPRVLAAPPVPWRDGLGDLQLPYSPNELVTYEVEADLDPATPALPAAEAPLPDGLERYLDVRGVSGPVRKLAENWTAGATRPIDRTLAIAKKLQDFAYSLDDEPPPYGQAPLDHFLFNRRAGHCEYFATALAAMSRAVGVPARMVGGYQGGARHPGGGYIVVRQSDAHAWAEVYLAGVGWTPVDATPGHVLYRPPLTFVGNLTETIQRLWEEYVVDFDLGTQVSAAQGMAAILQRLRAWKPGDLKPDRSWTAALAAIVGLAATIVVIVRVRRRTVRRGTTAWRLREALRAAVQRAVGSAATTSTVREWVMLAAPYVETHQRSVLEGARDAYERSRFGAQPLDEGEERMWIERLAAIGSRPSSSAQSRQAA